MLALVCTKEDDVKNAVTDAYRRIFINVPQVEEPAVEASKVPSKRFVLCLQVKVCTLLYYNC